MDMEKDTAIENDQKVAEGNAERLGDYFEGQIPDCKVTHRWNDGFDSQRFFFARDRKNKYILDVGSEVLRDSTTAKIIARLEAANWKQALESHSDEIAHFTSTGFTFRAWPK